MQWKSANFLWKFQVLEFQHFYMRQHFTLTIARVGLWKSVLNESYDFIKYYFCYRENADETIAEEPNFKIRNT